MEERKRGYQGRRLAGATPRQEPERRGSRTRQAEDKKPAGGRTRGEMTPEEKVSPVEATSAEAAQAEPREQSVRQVEDKARREQDPWEMTSEETAPITPETASPSQPARAASVAGGKSSTGGGL